MAADQLPKQRPFFGEALRRAIAAKGETPGKAAHRLGVSASHLYEVFNGAAPSKSLLIRLKHWNGASGLVEQYAAEITALQQKPSIVRPLRRVTEPLSAPLGELAAAKKGTQAPAEPPQQPKAPTMIESNRTTAAQDVATASSVGEALRAARAYEKTDLSTLAGVLNNISIGLLRDIESGNLTPNGYQADQLREVLPSLRTNAHWERLEGDTYGAALKRALAERGMPQVAFSQLLGVSNTMLSRFCCNYLAPSKDMQLKIIAHLPAMRDAPTPAAVKEGYAVRGAPHTRLQMQQTKSQPDYPAASSPPPVATTAPLVPSRTEQPPQPEAATVGLDTLFDMLAELKGSKERATFLAILKLAARNNTSLSRLITFLE